MTVKTKNWHTKGTKIICNDTGKRCYDRIGAMIALASCQRDNSIRSGNIEQRMYHCPKCEWYHLTSSNKRG